VKFPLKKKVSLIFMIHKYSVRALLGHASHCQGAFSELVDGRAYEERGRVEDGPSLYSVVHLEGKK
jgi:hypothetical protein